MESRTHMKNIAMTAEAADREDKPNLAGLREMLTRVSNGPGVYLMRDIDR